MKMKYLRKSRKSGQKLLIKNSLPARPPLLEKFTDSCRETKMNSCSLFTFELVHNVHLEMSKLVRECTGPLLVVHQHCNCRDADRKRSSCSYLTLDTWRLQFIAELYQRRSKDTINHCRLYKKGASNGSVKRFTWSGLRVTMERKGLPSIRQSFVVCSSIRRSDYKTRENTSYCQGAYAIQLNCC